jgi:hypothetical protein
VSQRLLRQKQCQEAFEVARRRDHLSHLLQIVWHRAPPKLPPGHARGQDPVPGVFQGVWLRLQPQGAPQVGAPPPVKRAVNVVYTEMRKSTVDSSSPKFLMCW